MLFCIIIDQFLWILHPLFLSLQEAYLITENQMMLESGDIDDEKYNQNLEKQKQLTLYLKTFTKKRLLLQINVSYVMLKMCIPREKLMKMLFAL